MEKKRGIRERGGGISWKEGVKKGGYETERKGKRRISMIYIVTNPTSFHITLNSFMTHQIHST